MPSPKMLRLLPLCVLLISVPLFSQAPTSESILVKHLAARGGLDKLKAIETLRLRGVQVLSPAPMELPMVIEQRRPNLQRVELTVRGMTRITTFDGKEGWIKSPWAANKEAVPLEPEEIKALAESDFDSPYLDWQAKGWKTEYLGISVMEGKSVHRVKFIISTTETLIGSFDTRTFQELYRERSHRELGNEIKLLSTFDDYQMVQGISFPFYILHRVESRGHRLKLYIDKIEVNPPLPDKRFARP
jgi:hypothetical protein